MQDWDVIDLAAELSRRGEEFALATVVWRQGPSSGQQGSRALITATGQLHGWIGGACAEPVVLREAQRVIASREARLLLLGTPDQFGGSIPEGMLTIPISCQSEGALQVYVEPVIPTPHVTVIGRSPMAHTLGDLVRALGWRADVVEGSDFSPAELNARSIVVIATQGHGDEEAIEQAVSALPAFVGLVASRRRGEAVLGYLADRGVPRSLLDRVRVPVGPRPRSHLAPRDRGRGPWPSSVQLRAAGGLAPEAAVADVAPVVAAEAVDPVCGMTVPADASGRPYEHDGVTYYFCCPGCRKSFAKDPHAYLTNHALEA
jgi:xanthine dehydrogenase accessory factor